jgi:4'-phosphopantetheinyl transferase
MSQSRDDVLGIPNWLQRPAKVQLVEDEVHLWMVKLHQSSIRIGACFDILNDAEKNQAKKFVFEKDRNRFAVSHATLRLILGQYLDKSPTALEFTTGPKGKPALRGDSVLRFNLSHSDHLILYAFSVGRELGVDVEMQRGDRASQEIVRSYFSVKEQAEWNTLGCDLQQTGFYLGWTRKEAYLKARGDGLSGSLCDFDVSLTPGRPTVLISKDADRWDLFSFCPETGSIASVVVEGKNYKLSYFEWREDLES